MGEVQTTTLELVILPRWNGVVFLFNEGSRKTTTTGLGR